MARIESSEQAIQPVRYFTPEQVVDRVLQFKKEHALLSDIDGLLPSSEFTRFLTHPRTGEIIELKEEAEAPKFDEEAFCWEATDIWVFIVSSLASQNIFIDYSDLWKRVNGQGRKSNVFDRLIQLGGEFPADVKAAHEILATTLSLMKHSNLSGQRLPLLRHVDATLAKVSANYPKEYMGVVDPLIPHKKFTRDEILFKYSQLKQMLRKLRENPTGSRTDRTKPVTLEEIRPWHLHLLLSHMPGMLGVFLRDFEESRKPKQDLDDRLKAEVLVFSSAKVGQQKALENVQ